MESMFYECRALEELNLNNYNTNNVIDMISMFLLCSDELIKNITSKDIKSYPRQK